MLQIKRFAIFYALHIITFYSTFNPIIHLFILHILMFIYSKELTQAEMVLNI